MMKRFPRLVLPVVLLLSPLLAAAQLEWSPELLDFGTIKEDDGKAVRYFTGVNRGDESVKVSRVRSSCGCTTAKIDTAAIEPGDSIVLPVTYNPAGRPGPFDKMLVVFTGDKSYKLNIIGEVIPSEKTIAMRYPEAMGIFRLSKKEFVFGEVPFGSRRTKRIYGYNSSPDTVVIGFDKLPSHIIGRVLPDTVPPSGLFCLSVTFVADRRSDFGIGSLTLPLKVDGKIVKMPATYTMVASPDYRNSYDFKDAPCAVFSSSRLVFDGYGKTKVVKKVLTVRNTGKSDLRIAGISSADGAVSVDVGFPVLIKQGGSAEVGISVDGSKEKSDVLNGSLIVMTNDPANPNKLIRLVGKR